MDVLHWILILPLLLVVHLIIKHVWVLYQQRSLNVPAVVSFLPWIGSGISFIANPKEFFEGLREEHGDTFSVYLFGVKMLCVFGPTGVASLYKLREKDASFTEATKGLLSLKLPKELLADNSLLKFHKGLKPALLPFYLRYAQHEVKAYLHAVPNNPLQVDLFPYIKRLVHRIGLACWVTPAAAREPYLSQLVAAYEDLDPEAGFQDLSKFGLTMLTGKARERAALDTMTKLLKQLWNDEDHQDASEDTVDRKDNLTQLHSLYLELPDDQRFRRVAIDVFHFQLASQANMYAGIAWCLVRLLTTDDDLHLDRVRQEIARVRDKHDVNFVTEVSALDELVYTEAVIQETLRLAQQSITLRKVLQPCTLKDVDEDIHLPAGWYVATLLSVTNMDARGTMRDDSQRTITSSQPTQSEDDVRTAPLDQFQPERHLHRPDNLSVAACIAQDRLSLRKGTFNVLTSTFGHGSHACPGRSFAIAITKLVLSMLLSELDVHSQFAEAHVPSSSVGALARVEGECMVELQRKRRSVQV